jgi:hypothetical protein
MITIRLGSVALQDASWGGPGVLPVARGPVGRVDGASYHSVREGGRAQQQVVSVLSLRLLGLLEITQTRTSQRSA